MKIDATTRFTATITAFSYKSDAELKKAHLIFSLLSKPTISNLLIQATRLALFLKLPITGLIKKTFFGHFCGGETVEQCEEVAKNLSKHNVKAALDYSVEAKKTEQGFSDTTKEILQVIEVSKKNDAFPFCVFKITGIADLELLEKVQNKVPLTTEDAKSFEKIKERVDTICSKAHEHKVPLLIDAENSWFQDPVDEMTYSMMRKYNKKEVIVFNTFQMYRVDMLEKLKQAYHDATKGDYFLGVKLVRGAYMEAERSRAAEMGYQDLICPGKEATDREFNSGLDFCVENLERITLICGSHNEYSNRYLTLLMERLNLGKKDKRIWFMQLYGMSDNISFDLAAKQYNVAKYLPYGPVKSVIPYLIRRAQENTSVTGQSNQELTLIRKERKRRKQLPRN